MAPSLTRREALGGAAAALVLASCGGGDPPPRGRARPGSGAALLGSLLALEHAVIAAYGRARRCRAATRAASSRAIAAQERAHADAPRTGDPRPRRRPARAAQRGRVRAHVPAPRERDDALRFAEDLEQRQVRAYLEALAELPDARAAARGGGDRRGRGRAARHGARAGGPARRRGPVRDGGALMAARSDVELLEELLAREHAAALRLRGRPAARRDRRGARRAAAATRSASTCARSSRRFAGGRRATRGRACRAAARPRHCASRESFARFALDLEDEASPPTPTPSPRLRDARLRQPLGSIMACEAAHRSRCANRWAAATWPLS